MKALIVGLLLVGLGVQAQADEGGNVHGCIRRNGVLRIAEVCRASETPLEWGMQGPQGLPGPAVSVHTEGDRHETAEDETPTYMTIECSTGKAIAASAYFADWANDLYWVATEIKDGKAVIDWTPEAWFQGYGAFVSYNLTCLETA